MMNDSFSPTFALPNILLIFDISALILGKTREWQEFSRVGRCFVTPAVLKEMKLLASQAAEPTQEQTAREFYRFYPKSGWQSSILTASHPELKPASGAAASKRARFVFNMAEAAYGLAQHQPKELVVLVSNDQSLLQRVKSLNVDNLCGIPVSALLLWSRTQRRPAVVSHQLRHMSTLAQTASPTASPTPRSQSVISSRPVARAYTTSAASTTPAAATARSSQRATATVSPVRSTSKPAHVRSQPAVTYSVGQFISQLISLTLALVAAVTIVSVAWRTFHPTSFNRFWQQIVVPALPGHPSPKAKPAAR
jgi:hypothetical protein